MLCPVCSVETNNRCKCGTAAYCSKKHQRIDWPTHKKVCTAHPAKKRSSKLGVKVKSTSSSASSYSPSSSSSSSASSSSSPSTSSSSSSTLSSASSSSVESHPDSPPSASWLIAGNTFPRFSGERDETRDERRQMMLMEDMSDLPTFSTLHTDQEQSPSKDPKDPKDHKEATDTKVGAEETESFPSPREKLRREAKALRETLKSLLRESRGGFASKSGEDPYTDPELSMLPPESDEEDKEKDKEKDTAKDKAKAKDKVDGEGKGNRRHPLKQKLGFEMPIPSKTLDLILQYRDDVPPEMFEILELIDLEFQASFRVTDFFTTHPEYMSEPIFPLLFNDKRNAFLHNLGRALEYQRVLIQTYKHTKGLTRAQKIAWFHQTAQNLREQEHDTME